MKFLKVLTVFGFLCMMACSGGGGGGGSTPTGGNNGGGSTPGGEYSGPVATSYSGFQFSATQSPSQVFGAAAAYPDRTLLGDKLLLNLSDAANYGMSLMVGDSECITDAPNGPLYNKTYSMVMVRPGMTQTYDPTWSTLTIGPLNAGGTMIDAVSMTALKATGQPTSFVATTTGTNGGDVLPGLNLLMAMGSSPWSCNNGIATYTSSSTTWEFAGNDSVMLVKTPSGSLYFGFATGVAVSNQSDFVGKNMEQYSYLFGSGTDDYNNCPSGCLSRSSTPWYGAQSGVMYSGSPVVFKMPQVGDQSPQLASVNITTTSSTPYSANYAPPESTTAKFSVLQGTGDMMGSGPGHAGRILGISAKIGDQYMSVYTHQYKELHHSNDINNGLGALILNITP